MTGHSEDPETPKPDAPEPPARDSEPFDDDTLPVPAEGPDGLSPITRAALQASKQSQTPPEIVPATSAAPPLAPAPPEPAPAEAEIIAPEAPEPLALILAEITGLQAHAAQQETVAQALFEHLQGVSSDIRVLEAAVVKKDSINARLNDELQNERREKDKRSLKPFLHALVRLEGHIRDAAAGYKTGPTPDELHKHGVVGAAILMEAGKAASEQLVGFAKELEIAMENADLEKRAATETDPPSRFDPKTQTCHSKLLTDNPALAGCVAMVVSPMYFMGDWIVEKEKVRIFEYRKPEE